MARSSAVCDHNHGRQHRGGGDLDDNDDDDESALRMRTAAKSRSQQSERSAVTTQHNVKVRGNGVTESRTRAPMPPVSI
jgi:hypothetical protein